MSGKNEYCIIMTGAAASKAALDIIQKNREQLLNRYPLSYLEKAEAELDKLVFLGSGTERLPDDVVNLIEESVICGRGGIFEALWKLGEKTGRGLKVDLFGINIHQAAIELCDNEDINPYESDSTGCMLMTTHSPGILLDKLEGMGIDAGIIGYTTGEKARVVIGNTVRYLTKQTE